jgi:hypothetical protein
MTTIERTSPPSLVTEIHRYSHPDDQYNFHTIEPDTTYHWNIQPFATPGDYTAEGQDSVTYREAGIETCDSIEASGKRVWLAERDYRPIAFGDLPDNLRYFVIHQQCPIQWHEILDERSDPRYEERVTVWVFGELPS